MNKRIFFTVAFASFFLFYTNAQKNGTIPLNPGTDNYLWLSNLELLQDDNPSDQNFPYYSTFWIFEDGNYVHIKKDNVGGVSKVIQYNFPSSAQSSQKVHVYLTENYSNGEPPEIDDPGLQNLDILFATSSPVDSNYIPVPLVASALQPGLKLGLVKNHELRPNYQTLFVVAGEMADGDQLYFFYGKKITPDQELQTDDFVKVNEPILPNYLTSPLVEDPVPLPASLSLIGSPYKHTYVYRHITNSPLVSNDSREIRLFFPIKTIERPTMDLDQNLDTLNSFRVVLLDGNNQISSQLEWQLPIVGAHDPNELKVTDICRCATGQPEISDIQGPVNSEFKVTYQLKYCNAGFGKADVANVNLSKLIPSSQSFECFKIDPNIRSTPKLPPQTTLPLKFKLNELGLPGLDTTKAGHHPSCDSIRFSFKTSHKGVKELLGKEGILKALVDFNDPFPYESLSDSLSRRSNDLDTLWTSEIYKNRKTPCPKDSNNCGCKIQEEEEETGIPPWGYILGAFAIGILIYRFWKQGSGDS